MGSLPQLFGFLLAVILVLACFLTLVRALWVVVTNRRRAESLTVIPWRLALTLVVLVTLLAVLFLWMDRYQLGRWWNNGFRWNDLVSTPELVLLPVYQLIVGLVLLSSPYLLYVSQTQTLMPIAPFTKWRFRIIVALLLALSLPFILFFSLIIYRWWAIDTGIHFLVLVSGAIGSGAILIRMMFGKTNAVGRVAGSMISRLLEIAVLLFIFDCIRLSTIPYPSAWSKAPFIAPYLLVFLCAGLFSAIKGLPQKRLLERLFYLSPSRPNRSEL